MICSINVDIMPSQQLSQGGESSLEVNPKFLAKTGFVYPIFIQTPSFLCAPPFSRPPKTLTVMALLDTKSPRTRVSQHIADALELIPVGFSKAYTASGIEVLADYAVDILFPGGGLRGFEDLRVSSCDLPYKLDLPYEQSTAYTNIGVLIGRDMMSRWNITWNGTTSCVFISE